MLLVQQTHVSVLLRFLINTYFSRLSSVLVVHDVSAYRDSVLQQEYLDAVQASLCNQTSPRLIALQWIDVSAVDSATFERQMVQAVNVVTEGFITILADTRRFLHARYYATRNAELRLKDKYYLFLCEHENPQDLLSSELLQCHGDSIWRPPNGMPQSPSPSPSPPPSPPPLPLCGHNASSAIAAIALELWTQKFVGDGGNLDAVRLDAFLPNESFAGRQGELYPNKLSNLEGRTLRLSSITYTPYVVSNYVSPGTGNVDGPHSNSSVSFVGSEAELMNTFCHIRNCRLVVEPFGADNWGVIQANGTSSGMLGRLYTQHVELAIGCIYNWYNNITETSHTIARSSVTILGPAPAKYPAWRTTVMPFSTDLWTFLISMILVCICVLFAIQWATFRLRPTSSGTPSLPFHHIKAIEQDALNIFAVFIQQPSIPLSIRCFAGRFFLATLMCATITLENSYSGQLKSILTLPFYTEPVDTMEKWARAEWRWGAPSVIWVQTLQRTELHTEQILTHKFDRKEYETLYNDSFRSDYGLGIERLVSGTFTFGDYITAPALGTKIVVKDDLYFDFTRAVAIRGWPLMPLLNDHVLAFLEAGLYVHWERQIAADTLDRQIQDILMSLASGHTVKTPPQMLTVANISGAFFALLFGYLVALLAFAIELALKACDLKCATGGGMGTSQD